MWGLKEVLTSCLPILKTSQLSQASENQFLKKFIDSYKELDHFII